MSSASAPPPPPGYVSLIVYRTPPSRVNSRFEFTFDLTQHPLENGDYYTFVVPITGRGVVEFRPELGDSISFSFMNEHWHTKSNMLKETNIEWRSSDRMVWFVLLDTDHRYLSTIQVSRKWRNEIFTRYLHDHGTRLKELRQYYLGQIDSLHAHMDLWHEKAEVGQATEEQVKNAVAKLKTTEEGLNLDVIEANRLLDQLQKS